MEGKRVYLLFHRFGSYLLCPMSNTRVLLYSWKKQVSTSSAISDILKAIFSYTVSHNFSLNLMYVPSRDNPADKACLIFIVLLDLLRGIKWTQPLASHIDLLALPFNLQADRAGHPLRFFAPLFCTQDAGTWHMAHGTWHMAHGICLSSVCPY